MEEKEETAQVISKRYNEGIIATNAYSFVLDALRTHLSRDILAPVDLVVVAMLYRLEQEATGSLHFACRNFSRFPLKFTVFQ